MHMSDEYSTQSNVRNATWWHSVLCLFDGRIGRKHFFLLYLVPVLTLAVLAYTAFYVEWLATSTVYLVTSTLIVVYLHTYGFSLVVRRLHDLQVSGWWSILLMMPWYISAAAFVFDATLFSDSVWHIISRIGPTFLFLLGSVPGQRNENTYGPPERSASVISVLWQKASIFDEKRYRIRASSVVGFILILCNVVFMVDEHLYLQGQLQLARQNTTESEQVSTEHTASSTPPVQTDVLGQEREDEGITATPVEAPEDTNMAPLPTEEDVPVAVREVAEAFAAEHAINGGEVDAALTAIRDVSNHARSADEALRIVAKSGAATSSQTEIIVRHAFISKTVREGIDQFVQARALLTDENIEGAQDALSNAEKYFVQAHRDAQNLYTYIPSEHSTAWRDVADLTVHMCDAYLSATQYAIAFLSGDEEAQELIDSSFRSAMVYQQELNGILLEGVVKR